HRADGEHDQGRAEWAGQAPSLQVVDPGAADGGHHRAEDQRLGDVGDLVEDQTAPMSTRNIPTMSQAARPIFWNQRGRSDLSTAPRCNARVPSASPESDDAGV